MPSADTTVTETDLSVDEINLSDTDVWMGPAREAVFAKLRAERPVSKQVGLPFFDIELADPQMLAEAEAQGMLTPDQLEWWAVTDHEHVMTVSRHPDLFASGRAELNPSYTDTLHSIASALNKVPGRVEINGHTDDQPLRSFRYRDNYELSRERAVSVVDVLKRTIDSPARLRVQGKGSSEPKYEDRALNRRVEIIHVRGT